MAISPRKRSICCPELRGDLRRRDAATHHWVGDRCGSGRAILGGDFGYTSRREDGFRLVRRYEPTIRLDERKLKPD
jgi:hypothetical protein